MAAAYLLVLTIVLFSGLALYDLLYTNRNAFASYDLLQYKPQENADDEKNGFEELISVVPDAVGWVTIDNTNIDYPIVQGDDDLEYASKDIFGNPALSGSIYLSSHNSGDFDDWYNMVYGHHMDNGAMFGDIEKFLNQEYFDAHKTGTLKTLNGDFELHVFACVYTNAYDDMVYGTVDGEPEEREELMKYIRENSVWLDTGFIDKNSNGRIVAFSTCYDATTNGRIVLFAETFPKTVTDAEKQKTQTVVKRTAVGHATVGGGWALLNLVCTVLAVLNLLPIFNIKRKYGQRKFAKNVMLQIDDYTEFMEENGGAVDELVSGIHRSLKTFVALIIDGMAIELFIAVVSIIVFVNTENMALPMVMSDEYTWLMVFLYGMSIVTDIACFRYHGKHPSKIMSLLINVEDIK